MQIITVLICANNCDYLKDQNAHSPHCLKERNKFSGGKKKKVVLVVSVLHMLLKISS